MKRKRRQQPEREQTMAFGLTPGQELSTELHAQALAQIDALADTLGEFGVSQGDGREVPALVLFLPSLQRIQDFILMHRKAVEKLAIEKALNG